MARYRWQSNLPVPPRVDADVFGAVVEKLANGDPPSTVPPRAIVDEARPRRSPIHQMFDWDDARAGEKFRAMQARKYVAQLEIVIVEVKGTRAVSTRGFFSVHDGSSRGYVPRHRILGDRDLKLQVIATARRELEIYINKYMGILSFGNFIPRLQNVMDDMRRAAVELETAATVDETKAQRKKSKQKEST
jgi:hypothetical protein